MPFSFADAAALATSCADLSEGVDVQVRNETASAQVLNVRLGSVADSEGAPLRGSEACGGLSVAVAEPMPKDDPAGVGTTSTVPPGGDAIVTLRGADTPVGDKTYTTSIVVYADAGSVSRKAVTVSQQKSADAAAVPLIDSRDVAHQRFNPYDQWIVWVPVDLAATEEPALHSGVTVGVLAGEHGTAAVTVGDEQPRKLTATTSLVPLHIEAVTPGEYAGTVDLTDDADTGKVDLSLTARHWWPLALIPLLAGIALAIGVQWANGFRVTKGRLMKRVRDTSTVREEARARLVGEADGASWGNYDVVDADLCGLQKELREEINSRTRNTWVAIDQKIVDDLASKIDAIEAKIGALDTIRKAAPLLVKAIAELAANHPPANKLPPLQGPDLNLERPRLANSADALLEGSALPPDDLVERATALTATTAAVRALRDYDQGLAHYWQLAGVLERDLPPEHKQAAAGLKSRLEGLRHGLWDADSPKLVDATSKNFDKVRETIDELWPHLPDAPPLLHIRTRRALPPILLEAMGLDSFSSGAMVPSGYLARPLRADDVWILDDADWDLATLAVGGAAVEPPGAPLPPGAPPAPTPSPTPPLKPPPPMSDAEADRVIDAARTTQWVVFVTSLLFAIVTAFSALYVGKAWGTPWDYLFAAAWGMTTQAVVTTIAAAIGGLGALGAVKQGLGAPRL